MMTKQDLDELIKAVEWAESERNKLAVEIVEWTMFGHEITAAQIRRWRVAQMAAESTKRDLSNCVEIDAKVAMEEN